MRTGKPKLKNIGLLLVLCVLILITAVLFLFIAQGQPIFRWTVPQPTVSEPASQSSLSSSPGASSSVSNPSEETTDLSGIWQQDSNLMLVNFQYGLPEGYKPKLTTAFDMEMDERIVEPYKAMVQAAAKDGITLWLSSAYRSPEKQQELFDREVQQNQSQGLSIEEASEQAMAAVARAGHSEHNTGLAIDVNGVRPEFEQEKGYLWLKEHAAEYGFILRYPKEKEEITKIMFEPWHFRYVGVDHARKMNELDLCLEEYVEYLVQNQENN